MVYALRRPSKLWSRAGLSADKLADLENEYRRTVVQILGGAALVVGLFFTWQQLLATREGQTTDRYSRAVQQLGDTSSLAVRLGGIFALERIARDSRSDRETIVVLLTAFVRDKQRWRPGGQARPRSSACAADTISLPIDVQAALDVSLKSIRTRDDSTELPQVDLSNTDLRRADLGEANLRHANLRGAHLEGAQVVSANLHFATLTGAHLEDAILANANLSHANFIEATLCGATLHRANLQGTGFDHANLSDAELVGAQIDSTYFFGADLRTARFGDLSTLSRVFADSATRFHPGVNIAQTWGTRPYHRLLLLPTLDDFQRIQAGRLAQCGCYRKTSIPGAAVSEARPGPRGVSGEFPIVPAELEPAIARARQTFASAKSRYQLGLPAGTKFFVVVPLSDRSMNAIEHVVLQVFQIRADTIHGMVVSDFDHPFPIGSGGELDVLERFVIDWVIVRPDGAEVITCVQ